PCSTSNVCNVAGARPIAHAGSAAASRQDGISTDIGRHRHDPFHRPDVDGLGAAVQPVGRVKALELGPHGALGDAQRDRDLLIRVAGGDEAHDLRLTRAEARLHLWRPSSAQAWPGRNTRFPVSSFSTTRPTLWSGPSGAIRPASRPPSEIA